MNPNDPTPAPVPTPDDMINAGMQYVADLRAELAQAKAELARIRELSDNQASALKWAHDDLTATKSALAEAQKDKERLDWLAANSYYPHDHPSEGVFVVVSESVSPHGAFTLEREGDRKALRLAIDAARAEREGADHA